MLSVRESRSAAELERMHTSLVLYRLPSSSLNALMLEPRAHVMMMKQQFVVATQVV